MEIVTERCRIRHFRPEDLEALCALLSSPEVMAHLGRTYSREDTESFLRAAGLEDPPLIYAVQGLRVPRLLGYLILHPVEEDCWELGWVLCPRFWGIGLARELTRAAIDYGQDRGIGSLLIRCSPEQTASQGIARHFGFSRQPDRDGQQIYRLALETAY